MFWLWMAWANGRGRRWAKVVFAMFCGVRASASSRGRPESRLYARADVALGIALCRVQLAAVVLVFPQKGAVEDRAREGRRDPNLEPSPRMTAS
jgi:hypothetical protein